MGSGARLAPTNENKPDGVQYSFVAKTWVQVSMPVGAQLSWDSYVRLLYDKALEPLQQQANKLAARGSISMQEARMLVESERNGLVVEFRKRRKLEELSWEWRAAWRAAWRARGLDAWRGRRLRRRAFLFRAGAR